MREKGRVAEQMALSYLTEKNLKLVSQNYSCRLGEIDLIMRDGMYLVFIEVRSRVSAGFGGGLESVTYAKRQKIIKSAMHYLVNHKEQSKLAMRFDVLSIDGKLSSITWLKDAFGMDY